jgi:hypothetical protein
MKASAYYMKLLVSNDANFIPLTQETFFDASKKHCPDDRFKHWVDNLTRRYIVTSLFI